MKGDRIDSDRRITRRTVLVGGMALSRLLKELKRLDVRLNEAAKTLLASRHFRCSEERQELSTVELSVLDLGFPGGAYISDIHEKAAGMGLRPPPIELAPHLRLQYIDQPEGFLGFPITKHRAPPGAITVASEPLSEDEDFPKGFYLRRIDGVLWLRGYKSKPDHIWNGNDRLMFIESKD